MACVEIQEWIEEEISKPVEEWEERQKKKCKKRPWYDPRGWFCWLVTYIVKVVRWVTVKVGKWMVRTVCGITDSIFTFFRNFYQGLWDILAGIFTLDWRRIVDGFIGIGIAGFDSGTKLGRIASLGDTADYIIDEYQRGQLRDYVRKLLEGEYSGEELENIKDSLRVDHGAFGYRIPMRAIRTFLDSETLSPDDDERGVPNLVVLDENGDINLRELCGFKYTEGFWNRKRYKTLKKGIAVGSGAGEVENPISESELDTYLSSRGTQGPKFIVLCMRDGVLKTKLRAAELKGRKLGLMPQWVEETQEVKLPEHIKHKGTNASLADANALVSFLATDIIGRKKKVRGALGDITDETDALQDLCTPVAVGVFRYTGKLRGIAACLKGSTCQSLHDASGATFIDNKPDKVWKYVPIHELGHYFGLCHADGLDRIMYSPKSNSWFNRWTLQKLIFTKGAPSFTLDEAKQTWDYIVAHFSPSCLGGNAESPIIVIE